METFVTHPEAEGPFARVVIYMDVWGLREELYDFLPLLELVDPGIPWAHLDVLAWNPQGRPKGAEATALAPSTSTSPNGSAN